MSNGRDCGNPRGDQLEDKTWDIKGWGFWDGGGAGRKSEKLLWFCGFVVCVGWVPGWADALNFDYPFISLPEV